MTSAELHVVTGAFSYTGKYITQKLLAAGQRVRTLTGHDHRPHPFGDQVSVAPFNFKNPSALVESLRGARTLYNTYWVRFPYRQATFETAVENTKTLIKAAEEAGVRKIVHLSVTNASEQSPLPYFRGKGVLEQVIRNSSLVFTIIRPTLVFGGEDVLLNNIAWFLRRFPLFPIPGSGEYSLQPVFVEDVAELAVQAADGDDMTILEAAGPELYTFEELIWLLAETTKRRAKLVRLNPEVVAFLLRLVGRALHDVVLTRDELDGLMLNLLVPTGHPMGHTLLSTWLRQHGQALGRRYACELDRNYR